MGGDRLNLHRTTVFKVLSTTGHALYGGTTYWPLPENGRPGTWMEVHGPLQVCKNALHLAVGAQVVNWLGPTLYVAEHDGDYLDFGPKIAARRARLLSKVEEWTEAKARMFSLGIAEMVLPVYEADCPRDSRVRDALTVALGGDRWDATAAAWDARSAGIEAPNPIAGAAATAMYEACLWGMHRSSWNHPRRTAKKVLTALGAFGLNRREAEEMLYGWLRRVLRGPEPDTEGVTWLINDRCRTDPDRQWTQPRKRTLITAFDAATEADRKALLQREGIGKDYIANWRRQLARAARWGVWP